MSHAVCSGEIAEAPLPDIDQLIDLAWRRQARAALMGRLAEARGWFSLWTRYCGARRDMARARRASTRPAEEVRSESTEPDETPSDRHDRHDRHHVSGVEPTAPRGLSRLRATLLEGALNKAIRSRDPGRIARTRAKLDAYRSASP
jgi:hypothetical protein